MLTTDLATRYDDTAAWKPEASLPPESPLDMPRQSLDEGPDARARALATSPANIGLRRLAVFGGAAILTALVAVGPWLMASRKGIDALEAVGFVVFLVLCSAIACWFCTAVAGFLVLANGREQDDLAFAAHPPTPTARTALLMPLYNEDAGAAFARLAALDASLARLGVSHAFDIFVLSDSTKEAAAAAERAEHRAFQASAHSRVYLRRRDVNTERKAGNIGEWVRRFGGAYPYMVVLDADSTMAGETVLRLVDAMERNPGVGLIQTAPTIIGAATLYGRLQQFGVRMYGRVAAAGLAWWAGSEGTYWGHNAILRTRAFAEAAGLPILAGEKPFGGHVLSHDVAESALMRRAGWAIHVTAALDGSSEETPPTLTDFITRDRRWCQGNLQHMALLRTKGLHPVNRAQLIMGVMTYLCSPLWFVGLTVGLILQLQYPVDWGSFWYLLHPDVSPFLLTSILSGLMLLGPKLMGCALVLSRQRERNAFGGTKAVLRGMLLEIALSSALAPILMVAVTTSVGEILRGDDAGWRPQQRDADRLPWGDAFRAMRGQMVAGLAFCAGFVIRPDLALSFAPVVLPLLFAAPIAVFVSRRLSAQTKLLPAPADLGANVTPMVFGAGRAANAHAPEGEAAWGAGSGMRTQRFAARGRRGRRRGRNGAASKSSTGWPPS